MALTFELDPAVDPALRDGLLTLWTDVSNADGAVGFVPPVTADDIRPELIRHFVAMAEGRVRLLIGHDAAGAVAATAFKEVGRVPDAIRVAPGDDRDDVTMLLPLNRY